MAEINADRAVAAYIKIRDARAKLKADYEARDGELQAQQASLETYMLDLCKATGQDGGKTKHGTFTRGIRSRYWTTDWDSMYRFIKQHDAVQLLEQRLHQTNMATFLKENPDTVPDGLNVDSKYVITVRRATTSTF